MNLNKPIYYEYMVDRNIETAVLKRALTLYFKYWKLIISFVLVSAVGSIFQHFSFPSYLATATLHVTSFDDSYLLNTSNRRGQPESLLIDQLNKKYIKIIGSNNFNAYARNYVANIINTPDLKSKNEVFEHLPENLTAREYTDILFSFTRFKGSDEDLINIQATSTEPKTAAAIANFMSNLAKSYIYEYESKQIADAEEYLDNEIYLGQVRIDELNKAIENYKEKQDMLSISMGETNSTVVRSLGKLKEDLELLKVHIEENKILTTKISNSINSKSTRAVAGDAPVDLAPLRGKFVDKLRSLADEKEELDAKRSALTKTIDNLALSMKPEYEQKIYDYKKKLDIEHNIFQELKRQLFDTRVYKIAISNRIRAYNLAFADGITSHTPLPKKLVMSMMISFFISFLLIYFWEQLYPTVYEKRDLNLLGLRHLGNLPYIGQKDSFIKKLFTKKVKKNFAFHLCQFNIKSNETAAFQFLRTRILSVLNKYKTASNQGQIMSVMSPKPGDGKSVIAMNVAVCMSNFGIRTLLIDCDLLKSTLSVEFDLKNQDGLSSILEKKVTLEDSILSTGHENLHFLPSGTAEKSFELLSSTEAELVLKDLKKKYDLIILDTPAFKAGPEGLVLASHSDMCLLVANAHTTKLEEVREILENIPQDSAGKVYGVINRYQDLLDFNKKQAYYY